MEKETLRCGICGGELERRHITHSQEWQGEFVMFREVPARVCKECGEGYFTARVSKEIFRILESRIEPQEIKKVPVWDYLRAAKAS